ncbi:hypothetical protein WOLCODRAFT_143869 [Wolfiporia cocos MD-104 SS10]|uniref:Uncharacterized protein n=1 Tax=Wolfiporia cocos (strain MD-104) TaxID=742152 RepID=A0A2H3JT94_WOLCO|nr:hypothetical protein WOLCODRAFT_143869 [Wolfiporia cocos MD-104 SS10]
MDSFLASDFQSPRHNDEGSQFDGSPNIGSPYDSFEFASEFQHDSHFPHTPSYNGSYQNSPYSINSELPPLDDSAIGLFDTATRISINEEYDPSEYDLPNTSSLLTIDDAFMSSESFPHVSITPPFEQKNDSNVSPPAFDHSSPASSNGGEDDNRSVASSSYVNNFTQEMERLHFESPAWRNANLPSSGGASPPSTKAQSPPQLMIPASPSPPPTINAPAGDGMLNGPQLHIVPATPISGGADRAQPVLFQTAVPEGMQQPSDGTSWNQPSQAHQLSPPDQNQGPRGWPTEMKRPARVSGSSTSCCLRRHNAHGASPTHLCARRSGTRPPWCIKLVVWALMAVCWLPTTGEGQRLPGLSI